MTQGLRNGLYPAAAAVVALLTVYGIVTDEQAAAWLALASALIAIVPLGVAWYWSRKNVTVVKEADQSPPGHAGDAAPVDRDHD